MKIAFLGLGKMGAPMARHLLRAGHEMTVWNRTLAKAEALCSRGSAGRPVAGARRRSRRRLSSPCWLMMTRWDRRCCMRAA